MCNDFIGTSMVISQLQNLSLAQYVENQLETELLKLGLHNIFFTKLRIVLFFFRHYAFKHQKVFELTDLTPDNLRPRMPMKMPKTLENILEQEEENEEPAEEEVSEDDRRGGGGGA